MEQTGNFCGREYLPMIIQLEKITKQYLRSLVSTVHSQTDCIQVEEIFRGSLPGVADQQRYILVQ